MKFKFKIISFISSLILLSTISFTVFADNDFYNNYDTYDTITNSRLCGIPYFSANTNLGSFMPYIKNHLDGTTNRICQLFPVKYYNNSIYIPIISYQGIDVPYEFTIFSSSSFFYNNTTLYRYRAFSTVGLSPIIADNNLKYPTEYANAQSLTAYNDNDGHLYMGIRYSRRIVNGDYFYDTSEQVRQISKFAHINNMGVIDYVEGITLGDSIFSSGGDGLVWCAIFRDFTGTNYSSSFYDLPSLFQLFGNNTGFTNGNDGSTPVAVFPRYPSSAFDNSGFYYDDLSSVPLSFYVKDYGNKHKYSLQIRSTHIKSDRSTYGTDFGGSFLPSYTWVNDELLSPFSTASENVKNSKYLLSKWKSNSLMFDNIMTIHFPCLDFSRVDNGARATSCTFNLSSFTKSEDTQFFNFFVLDDITGDCIGSCAVVTSHGSAYVPSSYPVKTYSWSDDNFDSGLPTGNNFGGHNDYSGSSSSLCYSPTISSDGEALTGNSTYYDGSDFDYSDYNNGDINFNVDISSLSNTFGTALDSTRQFFTLCIGLIPPAIIAFIFGTLALIVILRILGR